MNKREAQASTTKSRRGKLFNGAPGMLAISVALAFGVAPPAAYAQSSAAAKINIPAQSLNQALLLLGQQTDIQIYYLPQIVQGLKAPAVSGSMTPDQALEKLLAGTGIVFRRSGKNISLSRPTSAATELPTITVTGQLDTVAERLNPLTTVGSKEPLTQREIPQSVSVVTQDQIQAQSLLTVDDAVRVTPGVKDDNGAYFSRGYRINSVMIDGVPSTVPASGGFTTPLLGQYERVEVLRGPAGLYNGFGSIGGTVNLVRKRPTKDFELSAELATGTNATYRSQIDVGGPLNKAGTLRGRFVATGQTENLDPRGAWQNDQQFYGILEADITPSTTVSLGASYNRDYQKSLTTGVAAYSDYTLLDVSPKDYLGANWNRQREEDTNIFAKIETKLGNGWKSNLSANYLYKTNGYTYSTMYGPVDPTTRDITFFSSKGSDNDTQVNLDAFLAGPFKLFGRTHHLTIGANYESENNYGQVDYCLPSPDLFCFYQSNLDIFSPDDFPRPNFTGPVLKNTVKTKQYGIYADARFSLADPLTLIVGGRETWWNTNSEYPAANNPFDTPDSSGRYNAKFTPYAGLVYDINDTYSVYASYASMFQAQSQYDASNKLIDPLEGEQYEVGLKGAYFGGKLNTSLALFDLTQKNQALPDLRYPLQPIYVAGGKSRSQGVEATISGQLLPGWTVFAGYTFNATKTLDNSSPGAAFSQVAPKHLFKLWTSYRLPGKWHKFTVGAGTYVSSKISATDGVNSWVQGGYATVDASVSYQLNPKTTIMLSGSNLFNRKYFDTLSGPYNNYFGDLRRVMLSVQYKM